MSDVKQDEAEALMRLLDAAFGKLCGHGHEGLAEKPERVGGNAVGPAPGIEPLVTPIRRALAAARAEGYRLGLERAVLEIRDQETMERRLRGGVVDPATCSHLAACISMELDRAEESLDELLALASEKRALPVKEEA